MAVAYVHAVGVLRSFFCVLEQSKRWKFVFLVPRALSLCLLRLHERMEIVYVRIKYVMALLLHYSFYLRQTASCVFHKLRQKDFKSDKSGTQHGLKGTNLEIS